MLGTGLYIYECHAIDIYLFIFNWLFKCDWTSVISQLINSNASFQAYAALKKYQKVELSISFCPSTFSARTPSHVTK